ncbi:hypothetical protein [Piscinibacter sakaiensis]|uniref:hypothetical protein n=1 Tax=Piscinibacter sakaiensis TaxID=1547922 RepID=UPI003AAEB873
MTTHTASERPRRGWRWAGFAAALLVLLLVFAAWLQPEMTMQMAQQIWSCF